MSRNTTGSRAWRWIETAVSSGVLVVSSACYSGIDAAPTGDSASSEGGGVHTDGASSTADDSTADEEGDVCAQPELGEKPLRRLTRIEYNNTVRDLLGDDREPANRLPNETVLHSYDTNVINHGVSMPLVQAYLLLAEDVAQRAVENLDAIVSCDPQDGPGCASTFVADFCPRAFRRPCTSDELAALEGLWSEGNEIGGATSGYRYVIEAVLQAAPFLYRPQIGTVDEGGHTLTPLTSWEVASALSYLLWGSMPDEALFAAAREDALVDPAEVRAQAERMLQDPRAQATVAWFHHQWLGTYRILDGAKNGALYPGFDDVRGAMWSEVDQYIENVVFGDGTFEDLLTGSYTYVNDELARYYGIPEPGSGDELVRVELDPRRYAGILTRGAFLATNATPIHSSPVQRGMMVLRQFACRTIPPPPPDVPDTIPEPTEDMTTRERYETHAADPKCANCHDMMDGIGFGFEHFDGGGRWRDDENGLPIDASGRIVGVDVEGEFDGVTDLATRLADSRDVRRCYVEQWLEFALGRQLEDADQCTVQHLEAAFSEGEFQILDVIVATTITDTFLYRPVEVDP